MDTSAINTVRLGSGKPVLMVHGLGSSWRNWDPVLDRLTAEREVILIDLPGFGDSPAYEGEVTMATLTDAVQAYMRDNGLEDVDLVGSSMGARMVLELARRAAGGNVVALDPGGFWNNRQRVIFGASVGLSIKLVRLLQKPMPAIAGNPVGRTLLLSQFSAHPWKLPAALVLQEMRSFAAATRLDESLDALVKGPPQEGAPAGSTPGRIAIGWGRRDLVTVPGEARVAMTKFPDATVRWFEQCGHFPHWDRPDETADFILQSLR
ncbi:alpha/beta fold hydrolase [Arthrobacter monumenti]